MTAVEAWRRRVEDEGFTVATCIVNPYLAANIIYHALNQHERWPWHKIHRKWRVFQHVPRTPTRIATKILREA